MLGTERLKDPQFKLKLDYPVKPENPKKCLFIGYTETNIIKLNKYKEIVINEVLDEANPEKNHTGLRLWFHDAFEILYESAIKLHTREKAHMNIMVTPKVSKIDESFMDFSLKQ